MEHCKSAVRERKAGRARSLISCLALLSRDERGVAAPLLCPHTEGSGLSPSVAHATTRPRFAVERALERRKASTTRSACPALRTMRRGNDGDEERRRRRLPNMVTLADEAQPSKRAANSQWLSAVKAIAGTGAGVVSTALCSPLDVAKVRTHCARIHTHARAHTHTRTRTNGTF